MTAHPEDVWEFMIHRQVTESAELDLRHARELLAEAESGLYGHGPQHIAALATKVRQHENRVHALHAERPTAPEEKP